MYRFSSLFKFINILYSVVLNKSLLIKEKALTIGVLLKEVTLTVKKQTNTSLQLK
jgi:hypothetical protein